MDADRWKKLNDLFEAALARDVADRAAFLRHACAEDEALLRSASRLLRAHEQAPHALGTSVFAEAVRALVSDELDPGAGAQFGPYRVIREIGAGGMGIVYLAERADQQYEKRVAIKLMRRGVDTDAVLRLFKHERQILAGLDHSNITRLLDGGTADDGRPYFVMEYVDGTPVHDYCDAHTLSIADRLRLFRSVCAAVAYAHRHLVVHRDLKPSNILVTASGEPKLLDFGIAKLMNPDRDGAVTMMAGGAPMTPEYASPEQLEGRPVTTVSDVYSLGLVLYELLAGRRPPVTRAARTDDSARTSARADVPRPSTVVARDDTVNGGPAPQRIAAARRTTPDRLSRRLRGDLDTIVLKAVHADPARRYQSVEQLSEDIRRHREGLPILARTDSLRYRGAKFVRRNKAAVATGALVALSLVAGFVTTAWQADRARAAQARAERRFNDVRKLANLVLFDYHDAIQDLPGATRVRERLVKDALAYLDSLATESGDDPALQRDLAAAYDRVGDVLGKLYGANLGDTTGAMESYQKALRIREALIAADPRATQNLRDLAESHRRIGWQLVDSDDTTRGLEHLRRAVSLYGELTAGQVANADVRRGQARAYNELGSALEDRGDLAGALDNNRRALQLLRDLSAADAGNRGLRRTLSITYENIGRALFLSGEVDAALASNGRALELRAGLAAEEPTNADYRRTLAISYQNDGDFRAHAGDTREALDSFRRKIVIDEDLLKADPANAQAHTDFAYSALRLGDLLTQLGDHAQALSYYRKSAERYANSPTGAPAHVGVRLARAVSLAGIAKTQARLGHPAAAIAQSRQANDVLEGAADEPENASHRGSRAQTYTYLGEAYVALATLPGTPPPEVRQHWGNAREMFRRSLDTWEDMRRRGILSVTDADRPGEVARALARCDAMLANRAVRVASR